MQILRGEIYDVDLGIAYGHEQGGMRPCLILQNDIGNKFSPTTIIAPITSQHKKFGATHVDLDCLRKNSCILLEQVRVVDTTRIKGFICKLDDAEMHNMRKKIMLTVGL